MKLLWMRLTNFRPFQGQTPRIEFASGGEKNVTVVYGANGSGKTALLNALTWTFYATFTDAFASPDRLINRQAWGAAAPGETVSCWVELEFEHSGRRYHLKRTKSARKTDTTALPGDEEESLSLESAGSDGRWVTIRTNDIEDTMARILPNELHSYFFFDGERIERLQRPDKRAEITAATSILIGEEVFNRAVYHLGEVGKRLEAELRNIGDLAVNALIDEKTNLEMKRQGLEDRQTLHEKNLDGHRRQQQAIKESLRAIESVRALQQQRDQLTEQEQSLHMALAASRDALADVVSTKGHLFFLPEASGTVKAVITDLRGRGQLPSAIKAPFVRRLLEEQECICGRELHPGEPAYNEVQRWVDQAGMSDVEEAAIRMEGYVEGQVRDLAAAVEQLAKEQERRSRSREQLSRVETDLRSIRDALRGSPEEDARALEEQLAKVEETIAETRLAQRDEAREIDHLSKEVDRLQKEIQRANARSAEQALAMRRVAVCNQAVDVLVEVRRRLRVHFRTDLAERVNRLFSEISFKPYVVRIADNYELTLLDGPGGLGVGQSTGESQVLSLAFIGAIIEQAREFSARREGLPGPDSSTFPMVMDSPFGNLDPIHQRQVARRLPGFADQIVVFVSPSQWSGEVEQSLNAKVGKEYVLTYHTTKSDVHDEFLKRAGKRYDLVTRSDDATEHTDVVEVI